MKGKGIREMTAEQIGKELLDLRREQFNLRMQLATGQGVRTHEFGRIRKDIARLKTVLREREIEGEGKAS
ncbi:MAG TPA: 50S ribosomal protein L29 [Gammaproteobacteria bacterium]|nr:50S ribosomal protein L29 [Gammaproteobacteria bacterium]